MTQNLLCVLLDMDMGFILHDVGHPNTVHPHCASTCSLFCQSIGDPPRKDVRTYT